MSVFLQKDRKAYTYEFQYKKRTYKGSTGQLTEADAQAFELEVQRKVRRQLGGLVDPRDSPHFQEWAGVYYEYQATRKKVKRPERVDELIRVVLLFWGRRPTDPAKVVAGAPYHDLTLADPISEPEWLDRFEDWMSARVSRVSSRAIAGSTRNHYRSTLSGMYRIAQVPRYRRQSGNPDNPMVGVPRDRRMRRDVELTPEQILKWIQVASYHVRLAVAIAALAPKLRLANVLALEWAAHLDRALTRITVFDHKTDAETQEPIVTMVTEQLRAILVDAQQRNRGRYVVSYRGRRVTTIRGGVHAAATRAGLTYGIRGGVTFHAIRHAVATFLAEMENLSEPMRAALLAQRDIATTQGYTHLRPVRELAPLEQLSALLPIAAAVTQTWRRYSKKRAAEASRENGRTAVQAVTKPE